MKKLLQLDQMYLWIGEINPIQIIQVTDVMKHK